jgi:hypothetical protein
MGFKFLGLQIFFISLMAFLSSYKIPDLSQANWDTVLFLTPVGILSNHFNPHKVVLKSFYSDISSGQNQIPITNLMGMGIVYLLMIASVYYFVKRGKNKV